ncbi:unnamed protein product [Phaeothamnion confervicola]
MVLARFRDAAIHRDRNLVYTVMPVHVEDQQPPQLQFSSLGIKTPPPPRIVLRHLRNLIEAGLEHWTYRDPPEKVFRDIYRFLDEGWHNLSPNVRSGLRELPAVPVGGRMVKPSRLFFRLKEDLSPFLFEVPRAFGAFDVLFRALGTKPAPVAADYARLLRELQADCGGARLNPNELGAVLKAASLLAQELQASAEQPGGGGGGELFVPDDRSMLVAREECLFNDAPWLRGRVDPHQFRAVHPKMPLATCRLLGIAAVR